MQAPGVSIRDIFEAAVKCKEVYEKFNHPYRNAPKTLTAFKHELNRVERSLRIQEQLELWTGEHYPGAEAFKAVLEECSTFLAGKQKLLEYGDGKTSFSGALQVTWSAFDSSIDRLQRSLAHHRQEFSDFKIDLLVGHAFNRADHPDGARPIQLSSTTESDGLTEEKATELNEAVSDMVRILYKYKRFTKDATVRRDTFASEQTSLNRLENNEQLDASFCTTVAHICQLIDLPDQYRPHRITLQSLPRYLSEAKQQVAIEAPTGTIRYPPSLPMVFPRQFLVRISVTWQSRKIVMDAASYLIIGEKCVFHNALRQAIFEHRISPRPRLDTYHPTLRKHLQPLSLIEPQSPHTLLSVRFVELQDVRILNPNGAPGTGFKAIPDYIVSSSEDYEKFQTDLRGKRFLRDFFMKRVDTKNSGPLGNAQSVCLKLWEDNAANTFISLAAMFDVDRRVRKVWQIPLKFFHTPKTINGDTVQLQFIDGQRGGGKRRNSAEELETQPQSKWASNFKFLKLKFDASVGAEDFLQAFEDARTKPQLPLLSPSGSLESGLSRFTAPSLASSYLGSPMSMHSTPQESGLRRTSTAATSPMSPAASVKDPKGIGKLSNMLPRAMMPSDSGSASTTTVVQQTWPESVSSRSSPSKAAANGKRDAGTDPEPLFSEQSNKEDTRLGADEIAATPMRLLSRTSHTDRIDFR